MFPRREKSRTPAWLKRISCLERLFLERKVWPDQYKANHDTIAGGWVAYAEDVVLSEGGGVDID